MTESAVLLMAYGTPTSEADIEAYLTDVRRGRKPGPEQVEELRDRYRKIGGRSPLLDITLAQASALEQALRSEGLDLRVYVGMKHWHPYIGDVVRRIVADGKRRIIGLILAPLYSHISVGGYRHAVVQALEPFRHQTQLDIIDNWHGHPLFHRAVAEKVTVALEQLPPGIGNELDVIFTAHSLPATILKENDPYPQQLQTSSKAVAELSGIENWRVAYQSKSTSDQPWLGPDILELLEMLARRKRQEGGDVIVVPIGFVSDHLEILYDLDVEACDFAKARGLALRRTESLNTSPTFISALTDLVRRRSTPSR